MTFLFQAPIVVPLQEAINAIPGFTPVTNLGVFVSQLMGLFLIVASLATLLYLVLGGISWITAGSDKGKVEEARNRLTNGIIGLTIVAASWAVFLLLNYFFGLGLVGGSSGNSSTNSTAANSPSTTQSGVCIYPARRCCNTQGDSTCFCQPPYNAVNRGSCPAGGGNTGVRCDCARP